MLLTVGQRIDVYGDKRRRNPVFPEHPILAGHRIAACTSAHAVGQHFVRAVGRRGRHRGQLEPRQFVRPLRISRDRVGGICARHTHHAALCKHTRREAPLEFLQFTHREHIIHHIFCIQDRSSAVGRHSHELAHITHQPQHIAFGEVYCHALQLIACRTHPQSIGINRQRGRLITHAAHSGRQSGGKSAVGVGERDHPARSIEDRRRR